MTTPPCLRCGKELKSVIPGVVREDMPSWQPENQPSAGTTFKSSGHYGSTVWDPQGVLPHEFLEINICDECMVAAVGEGRILHGRKPVRVAPKTQLWQPPDLGWCDRCGRAVRTPHEFHDDEAPF